MRECVSDRAPHPLDLSPPRRTWQPRLPQPWPLSGWEERWCREEAGREAEGEHRNRKGDGGTNNRVLVHCCEIFCVVHLGTATWGIYAVSGLVKAVTKSWPAFTVRLWKQRRNMTVSHSIHQPIILHIDPSNLRKADRSSFSFGLPLALTERFIVLSISGDKSPPWHHPPSLRGRNIETVLPEGSLLLVCVCVCEDCQTATVQQDSTATMVWPSKTLWQTGLQECKIRIIECNTVRHWCSHRSWSSCSYWLQRCEPSLVYYGTRWHFACVTRSTQYIHKKNSLQQREMGPIWKVVDYLE